MKHTDNSPRETPAWRVALEALPLTLLIVGLLLWAPLPEIGEPGEGELRPLRVSHARELGEHYAALDYQWPPAGAVPRLALERLPRGLGAQPVALKKSLFFRALLPLALAENERLAQQRRWLVALKRRGGPLDEQEATRLRRLASRYGVGGTGEGRPPSLDALLRRVDQVPVALVLAQAANESGWGTSRFAREANNLFGEWTWDQSQGLVPRQRAAGKTHLVRVFPDLRASVRGYMHNLNSGGAYRELRALRAQMRARGEEPDALVLARGLLRYSERGEAYVAEIQAMIRGNRLHRLGSLALAPGR
ncbi:glucosaminidase domain-containing protein [Alkalilimnicola sp. S0819]|uniref:glucosaminidase domain-containing protein n=1 Tax=Alkalilimnicola sp. S0819 TaxID=2613922 RepID=UPI00186AA80B|nr:glucosaminidase domain-containing protein [Alkalilimnicola sp. S0819]